MAKKWLLYCSSASTFVYIHCESFSDNDCDSGSDSDHGVDIDGDNVSTSHSHIDSDGHSRFDNVMVICQRENDYNSYRHSFCYSDSEWKLQSDSAVRFDAKFGFIVPFRCGAMQILVVKKSMARWVPRLCLRVFGCCSVRLKPQ